MSQVDYYISAKIVDKDILKVDFIEKEIISSKLTTIDLVPDRRHLSTLMDVEITDVEDLQVLTYDEESEKWINQNLSDIIKEFQVIGEIPTKLSATTFRCANNYINTSLEVKINGLTEKYITKISNKDFSFPYNTIASDLITVNYIKKV